MRKMEYLLHTHLLVTVQVDFRAGNINIFYGQSSDQSASLNDRGDNNKISVHQENHNRFGDDGLKSSRGVLPNCDFVFEFRYNDQIARDRSSLLHPLWE
jgi:hypothetical protein